MIYLIDIPFNSVRFFLYYLIFVNKKKRFHETISIKSFRKPTYDQEFLSIFIIDLFLFIFYKYDTTNDYKKITKNHG